MCDICEGLALGILSIFIVIIVAMLVDWLILDWFMELTETGGQGGEG